MAALDMDHSPREPDATRACDDHGQGGDSYVAGSTTLGPPSAEVEGTLGSPSAEVEGARGFDADARSSHGPSILLGSSADGDYNAGVEGARGFVGLSHWDKFPPKTRSPICRHAVLLLASSRPRPLAGHGGYRGRRPLMNRVYPSAAFYRSHVCDLRPELILQV